MDCDDLGEDFLSSEISTELLSSHQSLKMVIYGLYTMINQFELHLDRITNRYKFMTLTWLLATYAGIGFFFSSQASYLPINKHFVSCIIGLFGLVGIISIWFNDICIYQRFWGAFYISEINFEKRFPFLGNLSNTSLFLDTIKARIQGNERFYMICVCLISLTIAINAFLALPTLIHQLVVISAICLLGVFVIRTMRLAGKKVRHSLWTLIK